MAVTPSAIIDAASHAQIQAYIRLLAVRQAMAVGAEDPATLGHDKRLVLAQAVLREQVPPYTLALAILGSNKIAKQLTDAASAPETGINESDMLARINEVWTPLAEAWCAPAVGA